MGSGFRTFQSGEVLTSSNVQNYLMDQAVTVFAGTAARGSAIASPETGMVSYRTDGTADSKREGFEFYDGANWTRLIPVASSGLVYITSATVTAQTTLTVNNVFSATYLNYFMTYSDVTTNVGQNIGLQFTTGGTANANANYQIGSWRVAYNNGPGNPGGYAQNQTAFLTIITDTSGTGSHGFMHFFSPFATAQTGIASSCAGGNQSNWTNGIFNASTSFDGIKLTSTANITGTFRFYGISNS